MQPGLNLENGQSAPWYLTPPPHILNPFFSTVGWALHGLVEGTDVPWHRVINARGQISLEPGTRQISLLREEGVIVNTQGQVDMKSFQWPGLDWPEIEELRRSWHANNRATPIA